MENKFKKYMELTGLTEGVVNDMTSDKPLTEEQENRIKFCMPSGVAKLSAGSIETLEEIIGKDIDGDGEVEIAPQAGTIIVETDDDEGTGETGVGEGTDEGDDGGTSDAGVGEGTDEGD